MLPIDAQIDLENRGAQVAVEARVLSDHARPLTWRMTVDTQTTGGANQIVQSGRSDGIAQAPVAVVLVSAAARGEVVLEVLEGGEVQARRSVNLAGDPRD